MLSSGYEASREAWAKRFAKNESLDRPYRITKGEVQSEEIPQDAPIEKKLAPLVVSEAVRQVQVQDVLVAGAEGNAIRGDRLV